MTEQELLKTYCDRTQVEFEYALNCYVRDFNLMALKGGTPPTTFWKALRAVLRKCGDKYNYEDLLEERDG